MTVLEMPAAVGGHQSTTNDDGDLLVGDEPSWDAPPRQNGRSTGRLVILAVLVVVVLLVAVAAVIYGVGPLIHNRDQRDLMGTLRAAIDRAVRDNQGLYGAPLPTLPPNPGDGVGILAIPAIGVQQAVVEGVGSSQTVAGPGHVPGTAGLGQPGNTAVVGRRSGYGGPLGRLEDLRAGDKVVTATTEGQSVYVVRSVRTVTLVTRPHSASAVTTTTIGLPASRRHHTGGTSSTTPSSTTPSSTAPSSATSSSTTPSSATSSSATSSSGGAAKPRSKVTEESFTTLYGPTPHNQITLVTSASGVPWNNDLAVVVVARMDGKPFPPTAQESRSLSHQGNAGTASASAWLVLALLALVATAVGAVALYRHTTMRSAYLLSTAPLLAFTVLVAIAASHLLPAWL